MTLRIGVPRKLVEKFLRKMVPLVEETIVLFTENAEADGLTPKLKQWILRFQIESWAEAYEDLGNFLIAIFAALSTLDEPPAFLLLRPKVETLDDLECLLNAVWDVCDHTLDDDTDDDVAFMDREGTDEWAIASRDDSGKPITRQAVFLTVALIVVFNFFSCMVHRKSLFQLVNEAIAGDDNSLLKAIQIDKYCLKDISYFRQRLERAANEADANFLIRVAQYQSKPTFQSGTVLNSLYLVFSLLDGAGLLDAYADNIERFADFCQTLGIYGPIDDAVDVESFARALRRFKRDYKTLFKRDESKFSLFVKDTN